MARSSADLVSYSASRQPEGVQVADASGLVYGADRYGNPYNPKVDARLLDILQTASTAFPMQVVATSGLQGRSTGTTNHPRGWATDIKLVTPDGVTLANYAGNPFGVRSADAKQAYPVYEQFAQVARAVQQAKYPELNDRFRWGGYFTGGVNPGDLMHFDISGGMSPKTPPQNVAWQKGIGNGLTQGIAALNDFGGVAGVLQMASLTPGNQNVPGSGLTAYTSSEPKNPVADLLARTMLAEARGEGPEGMAAVANVVANRARDTSGLWPSAIPDILGQPSQFAAPIDAKAVSPELYQQAYTIASAAIAGTLPDFTNGATYFWNPKTANQAAIKPIADSEPFKAQIGQHVFYGAGKFAAPSAATPAVATTPAANNVSTAEFGFGPSLPNGSFAPQLASAGAASAARAPVNLAGAGGGVSAFARSLPQFAPNGGAAQAVMSDSGSLPRAAVATKRGVFTSDLPMKVEGRDAQLLSPGSRLPSAMGVKIPAAALTETGGRSTASAMTPTLRTKDDTVSASNRSASVFSGPPPSLSSAGGAAGAVRQSVASTPTAPAAKVSYTPALVSPTAVYNQAIAKPAGTALSAIGGAEKTLSINPFGTKLANLGAAAEAVAPQQTAVRRVVTAPAAVTYKPAQPSLVPQASVMPQAPVKKEMPNGLFGKIFQNLPVAKAVNGLGNLVNPFNTGVAVNYGMVQPKTNAFAVSPFTPQGFTSPNFTPASGGSIYAYQTSAPGVGTYINSAGNTMHYNVNADQRVYGNYSGGFGGFQP